MKYPLLPESLVVMICPADYPDRIWFNPAKFWAATKDMPPEAADDLLQRVIELAELQELEELLKFEFVSFGNPWRKAG